MDKEKRLKEINQEFLKAAIMDMPGMVLLVIGVYAKFTTNAFHPLLNDQSIVNGILIAGGAIMAWAAFKMVSLVREKVALLGEA